MNSPTDTARTPARSLRTRSRSGSPRRLGAALGLLGLVATGAVAEVPEHALVDPVRSESDWRWPDPAWLVDGYRDYRQSVACAPEVLEESAPASFDDAVRAAPGLSLAAQERRERRSLRIWHDGTAEPDELLVGARSYAESVACGLEGPALPGSLQASPRWMPSMALARQATLPWRGLDQAVPASAAGVARAD